MRATYLIVIVSVFFVSCQPDTSSDSFTEQEARVREATEAFAAEKTRLQTLRDSLQIRIAEDVALGMTEEKAAAVENALIQVQETVVRASEVHIVHQREVLALMRPGK